MKVTIHQPEHMPWLGFFHKIQSADIYVVLDNVQYRRRYFQNRNKVRTTEGWKWVIVPLKKENRDELFIKDAHIFMGTGEWRKRNLGIIQSAYKNGACFGDYWDDFQKAYTSSSGKLIELNMNLLRFFFAALGLNPKIVYSSSLDIKAKKGDLIFEICRALKAKTYISGISGEDYLDLPRFKDNGIEVIIQEFHHPIYQQLYEPFLPCMSIIDLLFNHGKKSMDIVNGRGFEIIQELFL